MLSPHMPGESVSEHVLWRHGISVKSPKFITKPSQNLCRLSTLLHYQSASLLSFSTLASRFSINYLTLHLPFSQGKPPPQKMPTVHPETHATLLHPQRLGGSHTQSQKQQAGPRSAEARAPWSRPLPMCRWDKRHQLLFPVKVAEQVPAARLSQTSAQVRS